MKYLVLLSVLLAGCGVSYTAPDPNAAMLGTYALTTYNGSTLPTAGITSGSMALFADHYEFAYSGAGQPNAYTERGTWRVNAAALSLHSMTALNGSTPPDWQGTVSQSAISMSAETNPAWVNLHPAMVFKR